MEIIGIVIGIYVLTAIYGWAVGASKNEERNRIKKLLDERDKVFIDSFSEGRKWLANFIADCRKAYDDSLKLSTEAQEVAEVLDIRVEYKPLSTEYPMIKCNISMETGEKIYHLPFDQQYDKIVIGNNSGEVYVKKVIEAKALGFRRAWRYTGNESPSNISNIPRKIKGRIKS